jgi:hypothetical protein
MAAILTTFFDLVTLLTFFKLSLTKSTLRYSETFGLGDGVMTCGDDLRGFRGLVVIQVVILHFFLLQHSSHNG